MLKKWVDHVDMQPPNNTQKYSKVCAVLHKEKDNVVLNCQRQDG